MEFESSYVCKPLPAARVHINLQIRLSNSTLVFILSRVCISELHTRAVIFYFLNMHVLCVQTRKSRFCSSHFSSGGKEDKTSGQ